MKQDTQHKDATRTTAARAGTPHNDTTRTTASEIIEEHLFPTAREIDVIQVETERDADRRGAGGQNTDRQNYSNRSESGQSCRFSDDITSDELDAAERFLSGYRFGCRMLECARYERTFRRDSPLPDEDFDSDDAIGVSDCFDETLIRAKMFRVRSFVNTLRGVDTNSRMLLYWHYIRGESVARCAAMLGISRASAFRVRRRGLEAAARALRNLRTDTSRRTLSD